MNTTKILPHFHIVKIDETHCWVDYDLVERCGGTILGVYVYDTNRVVHCAELTGSYELDFLGSVPGKPVEYPEGPFLSAKLEDAVTDSRIEEMHAIEDELREGNIDSPPVTYIHCRQIDGLANKRDYWKLTEEEWDFLLDQCDGDEEAYDLALEEAKEGIHGNGEVY